MRAPTFGTSRRAARAVQRVLLQCLLTITLKWTSTKRDHLIITRSSGLLVDRCFPWPLSWSRGIASRFGECVNRLRGLLQRVHARNCTHVRARRIVVCGELLWRWSNIIDSLRKITEWEIHIEHIMFWEDKFCLHTCIFIRIKIDRFEMYISIINYVNYLTFSHPRLEK